MTMKYIRLDPELLDQLVAVYRKMFPHDGVPAEFYEHIVRKLEEKAADNPDLPRFLYEGVEALSGQNDCAWTYLSDAAKLESLKRAEKTTFFQTLRSYFVLHFYSNPAVWPLFGYEGPSNDQGGYLQRGFNDIDWIQ